ncbi:MAG: hypothetical protein ACI92S_000332, partial [Planctomycetaceae bacterium]
PEPVHSQHDHELRREQAESRLVFERDVARRRGSRRQGRGMIAY